MGIDVLGARNNGEFSYSFFPALCPLSWMRGGGGGYAFCVCPLGKKKQTTHLCFAHRKTCYIYEKSISRIDFFSKSQNVSHLIAQFTLPVFPCPVFYAVKRVQYISQKGSLSFLSFLPASFPVHYCPEKERLQIWSSHADNSLSNPQWLDNSSWTSIIQRNEHYLFP